MYDCHGLPIQRALTVPCLHDKPACSLGGNGDFVAARYSGPDGADPCQGLASDG
eukprot:SAG11_NODE_11186_length_778_cov_0.762887_1_plen_53_part_10